MEIIYIIVKINNVIDRVIHSPTLWGGIAPHPLEIFRPAPPLRKSRGGGLGPTLKILQYFPFLILNFFINV